MRLVATVGGAALAVEVVEREGGYRVRVADEWIDVDARGPASGPYSLLIDGQSYLVDVAGEGGEVVVTVCGETHRVRVEEAGRHAPAGAAGGRRSGDQRLTAPMPGRVVSVHVQVGDRVEPGAPLVVLEAMKMENEFRAVAGGTVSEVRVSPGQAVNAGDLLLVVIPPTSG